MHIMHVHICIKPDQVEAFKEATIENARNSIQEPGVARFDFLQQQDDPTRFILTEVYHNKDGVAAHRASAHYNAWAAKVANMFAEDRTRTFYTNVFPPNDQW